MEPRFHIDNLKESRILIVDDNIKNIQILGTTLKNMGFLLSIAQSGKEALKILTNIKPDLILLDIYMPEMDGFETCKKIKENPEISSIPVIFLTALTNTEDKIKGFKLGAVDYITKPFNKFELEARINTHLSLRLAHKRLKNNNEILTKANEEISSKNIQLEEALAKLEVFAKTDYLTNTYNRRYLYLKLEEKIAEFQKDSKPFSIIMSDIDYFKDFNDIYGHLCGDVILKNLSDFMQEHIEGNFILSRWGGEEFLILLPEANIHEAVKNAEKLRRDIRDQIFTFNDHRFRITLTFGVAEYNENLTIDNFIKNADEALYKGKNRGRNCVVSFQNKNM